MLPLFAAICNINIHTVQCNKLNIYVQINNFNLMHWLQRNSSEYVYTYMLKKPQRKFKNCLNANSN